MGRTERWVKVGRKQKKTYMVDAHDMNIVRVAEEAKCIT